MAAHYNFYCPYCNSLMFSKVRPAHEGSIVNSCPHCSKQYADPYSIELALKPFRPHTIPELLTGDILTGVGFGFVITLIVYFVSQKDCAFLFTWLGTSAVCWVLCFLHSLLTRKKTEARRLEQWNKSDQRLKNKNYALTLKSLGLRIPSEYLLPESTQSNLPKSILYAKVEKHGLF